MGKAGLWFKRLWKRLRSFRFTKKRVLLVSAVLAAAALGFGVWRFLRPAGGALPAMADAVRTTRLEKTTLSESITVTGTVESGSVANVTTSLSYPVKEIFVQVGDTVSEGDVICTLDSSDLEEQLAKRQEALAESRETAQKNYDKAVESYNSAAAKQTEAYNAYASAASALETARNTEYLNAANSVSSYQSAYDAALTAEPGGGRGAEQRQHGTFRCAGCLRRRTGRAGCGQRQPGTAGGPGQRGGGFDGGAEHGRGGAKRLHREVRRAAGGGGCAQDCEGKQRLRRAVSGLCRGGPGLAAGQEHLRDGYGNPPAG